MSASHEDVQEIPASAAFQNPYDGHRSLTPSEQELLGEYARLSATTRRVRAARLTRAGGSVKHTALFQYTA